MEMLRSVPPITLVWAATILILSILTTYEVLDPRDLILPMGGEIDFLHAPWRFIAPLFYMGPVTTQFIISILNSFTLISKVESLFFTEKRAKFVFILLFVAILATKLCLWFYLPVVAPSMLTAVITLYSKLNTTANVNVFMVVQIPIQFAPFINIIIGILTRGSVLPDVIGYFCGHMVFYLLYILPTIFGKPLFRVPPILSKLLDKPAPNNVNHPNQPNAPHQPLMQGRARRIDE